MCVCEIILSCPYEILRLDLACPHLAILGRALDIRDEFLFLLFELYAFSVELTLSFLKGPLVLGVELVISSGILAVGYVS